jgi:hypothetical protein
MNDNTELRPRGEERTAPVAGRRRTSSVVRLVLAGVAVVGIGAAITTAAWTDDVFFTATAEASSFDLQGAPLGAAADCATATPYGDLGLPGDDVAIDITTAELGALIPEEPVDVEFCLFNDGSLDGTLTLGTVAITGDLATSLLPADIAVVLDAATITAGGYVGGTMTVTPPASWTEAVFGDTGVITFTVTGDSVAPTP